jgi:hypothetical protein
VHSLRRRRLRNQQGCPHLCEFYSSREFIKAGNLHRPFNLAGDKLKSKGNMPALQCTLEFSRGTLVSRTIRHICKTLDQVASNNEAAAVAVMRAAERIGDEVLKQQLFNVIHRINLDAAQLRSAREDIAGQALKRA